eukprot:m.569385 g.569385  ORF g.569385 m.569385 type:complete len:655 (-) comp22259_c0_seq1:642-2606(-)
MRVNIHWIGQKWCPRHRGIVSLAWKMVILMALICTIHVKHRQLLPDVVDVVETSVPDGDGGASTSVHARIANQPSNSAHSKTSGEDVIDEEARRKCVRERLDQAMGWHERGSLFYLRGCNVEPVTDFESWSQKACGSSSIAGNLIVHVGWTGPWPEHFIEDIHALLDSFLATQDISRSQLIFWLMDREPDASDPLIAKYTSSSNGAVQFRYADVAKLTENTCVAQHPEMWNSPGEIQPQTKSDLLRLVLLHKYGGVWVDTDTILLRDLRPIVEYFGAFGGKFAMNQKYNNAMLHLRKGSKLGEQLLELSCQHPKAVERSAVQSFCSVTGNPCNPHWWYNHNLLQWATRNGDMIAAPLHWFDPGNNCASRGLLSRSGAREFPDWTLDDSMELSRGAVALHTRSYQAKERPLKRNSIFARLFRKAGEVARQRIKNNFTDAPYAFTPTGPRDAVTEKRYKELLAKLDSTPYPDPPYFPPGQAHRVHIAGSVTLKSTGVDKKVCLYFDTKGGRQPYELPMADECSKFVLRKDERAVWLKHDTVAPSAQASLEQVTSFRPSYTRTSNVFCLGASMRVAPNGEARYQECTPAALHRWSISTDKSGMFKIRNLEHDLCLDLDNAADLPHRIRLSTCDTALPWEFDDVAYVGNEASIVSRQT